METNFNLEITNISQFDELLKNKEELRLKKEKIGNQEFSIISYMVNFINTFDSCLSRETRGVVFNEKGELVSRPFHKFFNVGEKSFTQVGVLKNIKGYTVKIDGSLATPVLINGKVIWKTNKSFYSEVAKKINKFYYPSNTEEHIYDPDKKCYPYNDKLNDIILEQLFQNKTPLFEYVGSENRIVVKYFKEELIYLNTRDNRIGYYSCMLPFLGDKFVLEDFIKLVSSKTEMEGYVLYDDKDFYKLKTEWYLDRHRALDMISLKDLIDIILDDKLDDIISVLNNFECKSRVELYQKYSDEILTYMLKLEKEIKQKFLLLYCPNKKEFAEKIKNEDFVTKTLLFYMKSENFLQILKKFTGQYFKEKYKGKVIRFGDE
jgi:RNA ligase